MQIEIKDVRRLLFFVGVLQRASKATRPMAEVVQMPSPITPLNIKVFKKWYARTHKIDEIFALKKRHGGRLALVMGDKAGAPVRRRNPLGLPPSPGGGCAA